MKHWKKRWETLRNIERLKTMSNFSIYWLWNIKFNTISMLKIKMLKTYSMLMPISILSMFKCYSQCLMSICRLLYSLLSERRHSHTTNRRTEKDNALIHHWWRRRFVDTVQMVYICPRVCVCECVYWKCFKSKNWSKMYRKLV